jgi:TadE-like protein
MALFKTILTHRATKFRRDECGTTLVEFAICISLFLLILFAILDFGRLGYNWVVAEKAMQRAVRIAAVRPPVCPGVPIYHGPPAGGSVANAGTLCRLQAGICDPVSPPPCLLSAPEAGNLEAEATANEIWAAIQNLMPQGTTSNNLRLRYEYDPRLGFLGGPYVPLITVELVGNDGGDLPFTFITPLSALAANAGAANANSIPGTIPFPGISVSLPAEDMNLGNRG